MMDLSILPIVISPNPEKYRRLKIVPEILAANIDSITDNSAPHWPIVLKLDTLVHSRSLKAAEL